MYMRHCCVTLKRVPYIWTLGAIQQFATRVIMETERITDIKSYLELIETIKSKNEKLGNKSDLLFRGQGVDKTLLPKIARIDLNGSISKIETLILNEFKRGVVPLSEFKPENTWDLLALAQHHGLPTRLLDWSYNALVALWFAVEKPAIKDERGVCQNGVVWILSPELSDFNIDTKKENPLEIKITKIFRSSVVSRRISAQAGVFTVHGINKEGKLVNFESNKKYKSKLTKVVIHYRDFARIREQLHILGVNNFTIFPDIDGFCKHLTWRHSKFDDEFAIN